MDPEPRSLRPFLLLTTAIVVFGSAGAGFYLWWTARIRSGGGSLPAATAHHPVEFPPSVSPSERVRLKGLVDAALSGAEVKASADLASEGEAAVPPLLDALDRLGADRGFERTEARLRLYRAERALRTIRAGLEKEPPQPDPAPASDADEAARRVGAWFSWWEDRTAVDPH